MNTLNANRAYPSLVAIEDGPKDDDGSFVVCTAAAAAAFVVVSLDRSTIAAPDDDDLDSARVTACSNPSTNRGHKPKFSSSRRILLVRGVKARAKQMQAASPDTIGSS